MCPACGTELDGALNVDGKSGPKDGDPSICGYCAEVMVFFNVSPEDGGPWLGEMGLRSATSEEIQRMNRHAEFRKARWAVQQVIARKRA